MNTSLFYEFVNEVIKMSGLLGREKSVVANLTPKQCHMIMEIGTNTLRNGDLANTLGVDPSTLTRTLEPLVKYGLLKRDLNPANRREVLISLTDAGLETLQLIQSQMQDIFHRIFSQIPSDRRQEVENSLEILLSIIKREDFHSHLPK